MKINEYKNEVKSLTLSDDFKAQLKEKMLSAYNESHESEEKGSDSDISVSARRFSPKYSRYLALAACAVLVIATAAAATVGGLGSKIKSSSVDVGNSEDNAESAQIYAGPDQGADAESETTEAPDDALGAANGTDVKSEPVPPAAPEPEAPVEEEEPVEETVDMPDINLPDEENVDDDAPVETHPASGNGYSYSMSRDYDGDFDGADYTLDKETGSATVKAEIVIGNLESVDISPIAVAPASMIAEAPNENDSEDVPVEEPNSDEDTEAETESYDYDAPPPELYDDGEDMSDVSLKDGIDELFYRLGFDFSYKYYDIRDHVIADLPEVGLVRFRIVDSFNDAEDISENVMYTVHIDTDAQTLYSINIGYDYFNSVETDVDYLLINSGSAQNQLYGRPLMEGEYIAAVYTNGDGILEPIPQLIYAVHNINGTDLAYHVYSEDGFMVDPGDTNIGLNPEERGVITSTVNNPEIYTQKASVRELTHYLRRNILRMEPTIIDLESLGKVEEPEQPDEDLNETVAVPQETRSRMSARYPTGYLISEEGEYESVNGITVGDTLEDAVKAFYLTDYLFSDDCVLTLIASEESGGWYVVVTFEDGIVVDIESHIETDA